MCGSGCGSEGAINIPKGSQGEKGDNGTNGANGVDGLTPYIGENGNWFIGDTDTGAPASIVVDEWLNVEFLSEISVYDNPRDLDTQQGGEAGNILASSKFSYDIIYSDNEKSVDFKGEILIPNFETPNVPVIDEGFGSDYANSDLLYFYLEFDKTLKPYTLSDSDHLEVQLCKAENYSIESDERIEHLIPIVDEFYLAQNQSVAKVISQTNDKCTLMFCIKHYRVRFTFSDIVITFKGKFKNLG